MKGLIAEFKTFAMKGNVADLAVAVVIGGAFGKIVSSLVENVITPTLGLVLGGLNVSGLSYTVGAAEITYGVFFQSVIDFLLIAIVIFLIIKAINHLDQSPAEPAVATPAEPPEDIQLLREIRDSLKR
jgi:large conductance mechanosensitive channel